MSKFCDYFVLIVLFILLSLSFIRQEKVSDHEAKLIDYLFSHKGYNSLIRPVSLLNETLVVQLGLALIQLINVDEKNQIIVSNVWIRLAWNDYQLRWNPLDFGNLQVVLVPPDKIWRPDIVLFNNADGNYEVSWQPNVLIYKDGSILWIPPTIFKSSCNIDVTYFPFDEQICKMRFGSWSFDASQVALSWYSGIKFVDLSDYWKSETWDLVDCPGEMINHSHTGQPPRTEIVYILHIRRKTLFYTVNLICPCVLIAFLTFTGFYLPTDGGEKITLTISVLLALVVFLLLVSKILPPTSVSVPLISKYLLFTFILNIIVVVVTVAIININYRTPHTHKMPNWIRYYFMEILPPLLFMTRPPHILKAMNEKTKKKQATISLTQNEVHGESFLNEDDEISSESEEVEEERENADLDEIVAAVNFIAGYLNQEDVTQQAIHDWKYVASVIDKMMFILFSLVTIIGTLGILLNIDNTKVSFNQDDVIRKFSSS